MRQESRRRAAATIPKSEKMETIMANTVLTGMGFHHIALKCKDIEKSLSMYKALGMKELVRREPMCAVDFEGRRYDTGNLKGYLEATIDFALQNEEAGDWLRQFIIDKAKILDK